MDLRTSPSHNNVEIPSIGLLHYTYSHRTDEGLDASKEEVVEVDAFPSCFLHSKP